MLCYSVFSITQSTTKTIFTQMHTNRLNTWSTTLGPTNTTINSVLFLFAVGPRGSEVSCGGPPGGHQWRLWWIFPKWPCSAHGMNKPLIVMLTVFSYLSFDGLRMLCAQIIQNILLSVLRLTLRKMWIWLADQVSSNVNVFDFLWLLLKSCSFLSVPPICHLRASNSSALSEQM